MHFSDLSISLEEQLIFQRRHISNTIVRSFMYTKSLLGRKILCLFRKNNNATQDETLKRNLQKMKFIIYLKPSTDNTNSFRRLKYCLLCAVRQSKIWRKAHFPPLSFLTFYRELHYNIARGFLKIDSYCANTNRKTTSLRN